MMDVAKELREHLAAEGVPEALHALEVEADEAAARVERLTANEAAVASKVADLERKLAERMEAFEAAKLRAAESPDGRWPSKPTSPSLEGERERLSLVREQLAEARKDAEELRKSSQARINRCLHSTIHQWATSKLEGLEPLIGALLSMTGATYHCVGGHAVQRVQLRGVMAPGFDVESVADLPDLSCLDGLRPVSKPRPKPEPLRPYERHGEYIA